MTYKSTLNEKNQPIVLDASFVINLIATNHMEEILDALTLDVILSTQVVGEVKYDPRDKSPAKELIERLAKENLISIVELEDEAVTEFFNLVSAPPPDDLHDGEASVLALSKVKGYTPIIDEKKAERIAKNFSPPLISCGSLDVLYHESVVKKLGLPLIEESIFNAIRYARMRIPDRHQSLVRSFLSIEQLKECVHLR